MGDKAWSFTDFWSGGCVRYLCPFRHHLFTDNISTNSIVVGLFFLIIPVLQLKGRYLRVRDIFWGLLRACADDDLAMNLGALLALMTRQ